MKKYIVSGSSSGIGKAISESLLAANCAVVGLARDHSKFQPNSGNYHTISIDFSDLKTLSPTLKSLQKDHPQVDGIICCAGYGQFGALEQFSDQQIDKLMTVNFTSQVILIKHFLSGLKQQQSGSIILMGSESALNGGKQGSIYCASKFALRGFSQSLRKECATSNINVTLINPGFVNTPFFDELSFAPADPQQHAIQPEHISELVLHVLNAQHPCVYEEVNLQPMTKRVR